MNTMSSATSRELLSSKTARFRAKSESAEASRHFVNDSFCPQFLCSLTTLRRNDHYTDVTLKADDVTLSCHRVVLSAASPYFHAMFTSGLEESSSSVVYIKSTDGATLQSIIDYLYSAEISITTENVQNLVSVCDEFQFQELKAACEDFMIEQIEAANCIGLYKFAKFLELELLKSKARCVMMTQFKSVVSVEEFEELTDEELIEYISDSALCVPNEDAVFEAVIHWMNSSPLDRLPSFERVAAHVRLPYCSRAYLCHVVKNYELMTLSSPVCRKYLEEALEWHLLSGRRHEISSQRTVARNSFSTNRCLVLVGGLIKDDKENRYCWYFNSTSHSWDLLAQLPRPNWKFYSACVVQGGILLSGGYHGNVKKECWLFDTMEKKWKSVPSMKGGRCKHRAVVHCDEVYVVGGEDDLDRPLDSVERMCNSTRLWSEVPPMKKALSDPLAASFAHSIYVFGGIAGEDTTCTCTQKYDTVWGEWSFKAEMPEPCRLGAVATVNDRVFIVGGYTRTCMSYDPAVDTWTILTPPREKHGNAPVVVWEGKLLVGGGDVTINQTTSAVEEYDLEADKWSFWSQTLKTELSCHYLLNVDLHGL